MLTNLGQIDDEQCAKELGASAFFIKSNVPIINIVEWIKKQLE